MPDPRLVLVVIDGWGYNPDPFGNAIAAARKPNWDGLWARWPHTTLAAAGEPVGLPAGQQGNSEVGHLNIGAGRIVYQDLTRIDLAIRDGSFFRNGVLLEAMRATRAASRALHLIGLVSPGGVHSSAGHLYASLRMARQIGVRSVHVHAITDGRDEPPTSGARYVADLAAEMQAIGIGRIASVSGRYYAMDRDRRWDRTERAYRTIVEGTGPTAADAVAFITDSYRQGITDEFLVPTRIVPVDADPPPPMRDGDSVIFFNFRPDRARQLTHAIVDPTWDHFSRPARVKLAHFVTFTEYEKGLPVEAAFTDEPLAGVVAEVVSRAGLRQFHTAETEKYAHVTYFLNGGREQPFEGEERLLVPSPKVATYDLQPAMSAVGVAQAVLDRIAAGTDAFIVVEKPEPPTSTAVVSANAASPVDRIVRSSAAAYAVSPSIRRVSCARSRRRSPRGVSTSRPTNPERRSAAPVASIRRNLSGSRIRISTGPSAVSLPSSGTRRRPFSRSDRRSRAPARPIAARLRRIRSRDA